MREQTITHSGPWREFAWPGMMSQPGVKVSASTSMPRQPAALFKKKETA